MASGSPPSYTRPDCPCQQGLNQLQIFHIYNFYTLTLLNLAGIIAHKRVKRLSVSQPGSCSVCVGWCGPRILRRPYSAVGIFSPKNRRNKDISCQGILISWPPYIFRSLKILGPLRNFKIQQKLD